MKTYLTIGFATALANAVSPVPAQGQGTEGEGSAHLGALTLTCADLAGLDAALGTGIIHYIAGYSDGQRAMLAASDPANARAGSTESGEVGDASGTTEADASAGATSEGSAAEAPKEGGGLGIPIEQILVACAESPDSPASEVIALARGATQPDVDPQDEDPAAEGEDGQDVGSGNAVVE
jgi:hypothetical protein